MGTLSGGFKGSVVWRKTDANGPHHKKVSEGAVKRHGLGGKVTLKKKRKGGGSIIGEGKGAYGAETSSSKKTSAGEAGKKGYKTACTKNTQKDPQMNGTYQRGSASYPLEGLARHSSQGRTVKTPPLNEKGKCCQRCRAK